MHGGESLAGAASLEDRQLRLLWLALLGSLVLHLLILLLLPILKEAQSLRIAPPLTAHLAKPVPPKPAPPEPPRLEPLPQLAAPRQAARPRPAPQPVPAPVLSMESSKQAPEPAFVVPPAPAQPAATPSPRVDEKAVAAANGPDPGSVARFRLELMEIARRYKRYPRIAQDNNWEGRVELRIAFAESGAMTLLAVKKSTGRTVLDEEAQSMIRSAQPQASIPPALRGKAFTLEIPVDFSLRDER